MLGIDRDVTTGAPRRIHVMAGGAKTLFDPSEVGPRRENEDRPIAREGRRKKMRDSRREGDLVLIEVQGMLA